MAQDQSKTSTGGNKTSTGGNKPKPGNGPTGGQGQSAKDRSRAQSRPVSAKAPSGKAAKSTGADKGGRPGGNKPRPGSRPAPAAPGRRVSGALMAWAAVGLVVIIIVVLVVVKATGSTTNNTTYTPVTAAPASVVHDVTHIPQSVYDTVGVTSSTFPVTPPTVVHGQPPLTLNGKTPSMLYVGAEYCPFCAAERWGLTAALSRFGTWSGLQITASSHTDYAPATNTFSYHGASITSPYIHFVGVETDSNVPNPNFNPPYKPLQALTPEQQRIALKYSSSKFFSSSQGGISFPFVSINNQVLISGASYDPNAALAGQSWQEIASGLSDPTNPVTQAIVATANYISAGICASTNHAPASVCNSSGVQAAAKALKLS